jgi:cobalt-zinc-cadmium efflux system protein
MTHDLKAERPHKRRLWIALLLAASYLTVEVVAGLWTHSLALLADAGHMLTDVGGLTLALTAIWFSEKPATPELTYGYYRGEILAALANSVVLIVVSIYILLEAYQRFQHPPAVAGGTMLVVAGIGLLVNLASLFVLKGGSQSSLNVKGAYLEVVSDMLSSIGVIIAALVIWRTGWRYADPLVSAGIGLFILPRTWKLMSEAIGVLLEGTPASISLPEVRNALAGIPGVLDVHDLHVWTLTSQVYALSAHCVVADSRLSETLLGRVRKLMHRKFNVSHVTLQVELEPCGDAERHA